MASCNEEWHSDGERYSWLHYDDTKAMMRAFAGESGVVVLSFAC